VRLTTNEVLLLAYLHDRGAPVQRAELLQQVFGYAPGVRSRAVDMALVRLRAKLEDNPKEPQLLCSSRGVGVWLEAAEPAPEAPAIAVPTLRFGTPYVPREPDEDAVADLLDAGWRVVSIVGPGGVGKTRLAVEASRRVDGEVVIVPLGGCVDAAAVVQRVGAVLGAEGVQGIHRALAARGALCLLDEAEDALAAVSELVTSSDRARFLVTSRQPLGVDGEAVVELGGLSGEAATSFFRSRLAASRHNRDVSEALVARALSHLDGLPLAMELAAAHPGGLASLVDGLDDGAVPRRGWLSAALQRSLAPLDDDQRRVLALLSLCEGPLRTAEIRGLVGDGGMAAFDGLVDRSLLARQDGGWLVLRTVRTELATHDLPWDALREHRDAWLTERAEALHRAWRSDLGVGRDLQRLWPTLTAALPSLSPERTVRIAVAVVHTLDMIGPVGLRHSFLRAAVARCPTDPRALALSALLPESGDAARRCAPAIAHDDPDIRFLGLDVHISTRAGEVPSSTFQGWVEATDDPYQRRKIELWRLDAQTFHEGTGLDELTTHVTRCAPYQALHLEALRILADVHYGRDAHHEAVSLYDEVLRAYERHDLRRAVLVTSYLRALSLGAIDPRQGMEAHLANVEARARYGEPVTVPQIAAGLLAYRLRALDHAEELLAAAVRAGAPARRRVMAEGVLAACRLWRGDPTAITALLAVDDVTYDRRHRDQSPAGPAFRTWAHGEVALFRGEPADEVVAACAAALAAPVRPTLRDLLEGLRQRASARS